MLTFLLALSLQLQPAAAQATPAATPHVTITGNVVKPGEYALTGTTTIVKLLSLAGGLTAGAKKDAIRISRLGHVAMYFDFVEFSKGRNVRQNITLQAGDTVFVP